jgi:hypothetical protein
LEARRLLELVSSWDATVLWALSKRLKKEYLQWTEQLTAHMHLGGFEAHVADTARRLPASMSLVMEMPVWLSFLSAYGSGGTS